MQQGDRPRALQVVRRKRVGRPAARRRPLRLYRGQLRPELGELPVERRHGTPFVQARQVHGPQIDGPGQRGRVRHREQLHGGQDGDGRQQGENGRAACVHRPRGRCGRVAAKHAEPSERIVRQIEKIHRCETGRPANAQ